MSQASPTIGANKSGLVYRQEDNDAKTALLNHHKGPSAPDYAEAGMLWVDDIATPWLLKFHDGADWIVLGAVNASDNTFLPYLGAGALNILPYSDDAGSANDYAVTPAPDVAAYTIGQVVLLKPANTATGASTLTVGALGAKDIKLADGSDVASGMIAAGGMHILVYNGANFILTNPVQITSLPDGTVIDHSYARYVSNASLTSVIPEDNTVPQATEGTEIVSVSLTPKSSTNRVRIVFSGFGAVTSSSYGLATSLTIDGGPAVMAGMFDNKGTDGIGYSTLIYEYVPGDTSAHTYAIRVGPTATGSVRMNGNSSGRYFGGVAASTLIAEEIKSS
jgi:hypothetical protein